MDTVEIDTFCRNSLFVFNKDLNIKRGITEYNSDEVEEEGVSEACAAESPPSLGESDEADKVSWFHPGDDIALRFVQLALHNALEAYRVEIKDMRTAMNNDRWA